MCSCSRNNLKLLFLLTVMLTCASCTNKHIILPAAAPVPAVIVVKVCSSDTVATPSYEKQLKSIFKKNCNDCHSAPGSGGINLDTYSECKALAESGQLVQVITCAPGEICMPPPPQVMDTCDRKMIQKWVKLNCPN
jgi:cytochrome c5